MTRILCILLAMFGLACAAQKAKKPNPAAGKNSAAAPSAPSTETEVKKENSSDLAANEGRDGPEETVPSNATGDDDGSELEIEDVDLGTSELSGENSRLTISGLRLDDSNTATVTIVRGHDGETFTTTWPAGGASAVIEDVCNRSKVTLKITVTVDGHSVTPGPGACIIGQVMGDNQVKVAFEDPEDSCGGGTDPSRIDDAAAAWSCASVDSKLTIENLTIVSGI